MPLASEDLDPLRRSRGPTLVLSLAMRNRWQANDRGRDIDDAERPVLDADSGVSRCAASRRSAAGVIDEEQRAFGEPRPGVEEPPQLGPAAIRGDDESVLPLPEEVRGQRTGFGFHGPVACSSGNRIQRQVGDGPTTIKRPGGFRSSESADLRIAARPFDHRRQKLILLVPVHAQDAEPDIVAVRTGGRDCDSLGRREELLPSLETERDAPAQQGDRTHQPSHSSPSRKRWAASQQSHGHRQADQTQGDDGSGGPSPAAGCASAHPMANETGGVERQSWITGGISLAGLVWASGNRPRTRRSSRRRTRSPRDRGRSFANSRGHVAAHRHRKYRTGKKPRIATG